MGLGSHGIFVPGHKFRGLGLILLELLGLGQKSLGQSRDFDLWTQVPGTKIVGTGSPVPCPSLAD